MTSRETRVSKLEQNAGTGQPKYVVRYIEGQETLEEAWTKQHGETLMPALEEINVIRRVIVEPTVKQVSS